MSDDAPQLNAANIDNGLIRLDWSDTTSSIFHPIWLRDNCRCESCGDPAIGYRNLRLRGAYGSYEYRGRK